MTELTTDHNPKIKTIRNAQENRHSQFGRMTLSFTLGYYTVLTIPKNFRKDSIPHTMPAGTEAANPFTVLFNNCLEE